MGPTETLEQIAYVLEEQNAESYKVKAFRHAAETIRPIPVAELEQLAGTGRLSKLPGVGDTTARVIKEALQGEEPEYLRNVVAELPPPLKGDAAKLRKRLKGDCHSHSDWSDGGSPIATMAEAARAIGHEYWSLTDHSARLTVAHGLDADRLRKQLEIVAELNEEHGTFPDPHRYGGGHPRRRHSRPGGGSPRPARRRSGERPLEASDGIRSDDPSDDRSDREPEHRHPWALHRPQGRRARSARVYRSTTRP